MASTRCVATLVLTAAIGGCSSVPGEPTVDGRRVRSAIEQHLGVALKPVPKVVQTATLSNVVDIYSAWTSSERILVVVFDSPAATSQVVGKHARMPGSDVLRRGNVAVVYTRTPRRGSRVSELRQAIADAFNS